MVLTVFYVVCGILAVLCVALPIFLFTIGSKDKHGNVRFERFDIW